MKTINIVNKLAVAILLTFTFSLSTVIAQNDTMYVMKADVVVGKYNVNTEVDSVIFYKPEAPSANTFTDARDGNVYKTVTIGTQVWMAENLRYLPSVVRSGTSSSTIPYYYVYEYNGTVVADAKATSNYTTYGVLYNWAAAMNGAASSTANPSGVQGVCPTGWHLPSDAEWTTLTTYLGSESVAGKLKETGTTHWLSPNEGATNETGFTALPGGDRSFEGFEYMGELGNWWSSSESSTNEAWNRYMANTHSAVNKDPGSKSSAFSVRCVKD